MYYLMSTHPDLQHVCQNLNQFGYGKGTLHGGLSDYTIIPAKYAYLLRTDLDDNRAAILEREYWSCNRSENALWKTRAIAQLFSLVAFELFCPEH